jgi:hypothetical protein
MPRLLLLLLLSVGGLPVAATTEPIRVGSPV